MRSRSRLRAGLRHARNQVTKEGDVFEIVSPTQAEPLMPELKTVSDAWLDDRKTREKWFSLGFFEPQYLNCFPLGLVKKDQKILAFANNGSERARTRSPFWNRVADLIYHNGENFYNFQGVKNYKDKFEPEWQARFLASPGGIVLPTILTNLAALTSRGLKGVITK